MLEILDDKTQYCLPFILEKYGHHVAKHARQKTDAPFFVGLNGVQGNQFLIN